MGAWMSWWMDGWVDRWMDELLERWMHVLVDGWTSIYSSVDGIVLSKKNHSVCFISVCDSPKEPQRTAVASTQVQAPHGPGWEADGRD